MKVKEISRLLYIFAYMLEPNKEILRFFKKNCQNLSTRRGEKTIFKIKLAKFSPKKQKEKKGLGYGRCGEFPSNLHPPKTPGPFCLLLLSWKLWGTNHFTETLALIAGSKLVRKIFKTLNST